MKKIISTMEQALGQQEGDVKVEDSRLNELKRLADKISEGIKARRDELAPLFEQTSKNNDIILKKQQLILDKVLKKKSELKGVSKKAVDANEKLKSYFLMQKKLSDNIARINQEVESLRLELKHLINESDLLRKKKGRGLKTGASAFDFEKKFRQVDKKRGLLENEIINLGRLIKGK